MYDAVGWIAITLMVILVLPNVILAIMGKEDHSWIDEDMDDRWDDNWDDLEEELPEFPFYAKVTVVPLTAANAVMPNIPVSNYLEVGSKLVILGEISNSEYDDFIALFIHTGTSFCINR